MEAQREVVSMPHGKGCCGLALGCALGKATSLHLAQWGEARARERERGSCHSITSAVHMRSQANAAFLLFEATLGFSSKETHQLLLSCCFGTRGSGGCNREQEQGWGQREGQEQGGGQGSPRAQEVLPNHRRKSQEASSAPPSSRLEQALVRLLFSDIG